MTLNTSVAIHGAYNVQEIYVYCRTLLNTPQDVEPNTGTGHRAGTKYIANPGGIGLDAWLWINYGADGPMVHVHDEWCSIELGGKWNTTQEEIDDHSRYVAENPTENGWAGIEVTFDTAYGHKTAGGENCSALHARLVRDLGAWLDDRGLLWKWQNEYTGEWFDRYDKLAEFAGEHSSSGADAWFQNSVMPVIRGMGGTTT